MSHSGSSSGSGSPRLDAETMRLLEDLPLQARIGEALDKLITGLPDEVAAVFLSLGANIKSSRHLKTSFHKTFLVELSPALVHEKCSHEKVIVQVLGVELGDKDVFGELTAATLVRAHELAVLAGVRVPAVFATGTCESDIGKLDFIVEEFVVTQTVEDKVRAPMEEWKRIRKEVIEKLKGLSLAGVDTLPLPRHDTCQSYVDWLLKMVPASDEVLAASLSRFRSDAAGGIDGVPVLLHQDINDGNLLCSKSPNGDGWKLDALIDWESAAVVDARCYENDKIWDTVQTFAVVVKCAHLAERFVQKTLPRCELQELLKNYEQAARKLDKQGFLPFETWAVRVERSRKAHAEAVSAGYSGAGSSSPVAP